MEYTRLPGKKKGFYRKCTTWLGEDHILAVESNYYTESYKRFYFKDVQALIIRKTDRFAGWNIVLAILATTCLLSLMAAVARHHRGLIVFSGMALLVLVVVLAIHLRRGPTCACHLKMPLAVHELPSLCRLKYARQVLAELTPLVQRFQGSLSLDEIKAAMIRREVAPGLSEQAAVTPPHRELKEYSGFVHMLLFGMLILDAALTLVRFYSDHSVVILLNVISGSAVFILVITALVRQRGRSLPRTVKGVVWTALALCSSMTVFGYVIGMVRGIQKGVQKAQMTNQWDQVSVLVQTGPAHDPVIAKAYTLYIIMAVILGVWGLAAVMAGRLPAKRRGPASARNAEAAVGAGAGV